RAMMITLVTRANLRKRQRKRKKSAKRHSRMPTVNAARPRFPSLSRSGQHVPRN
ncbi:hypothetical protein LPJ54_003960, partial [Coemansia sp. RSA 1824]